MNAGREGRKKPNWTAGKQGRKKEQARSQQLLARSFLRFIRPICHAMGRRLAGDRGFTSPAPFSHLQICADQGVFDG
ncbi:hypothetical protein [Candidatus Pseudoscillospira sp. SGI.172]|uniref:hypothetical protein n=1 Tax=Candidatus Pseudoscillospira sp. SGI.172 TaxID=3420582 RepID=UPI003CFE8C35